LWIWAMRTGDWHSVDLVLARRMKRSVTAMKIRRTAGFPLWHSVDGRRPWQWNLVLLWGQAPADHRSGGPPSVRLAATPSTPPAWVSQVVDPPPPRAGGAR